MAGVHVLRAAMLSIAVALLLAACTPAPEAERHAFFALGTLIEISVYAPPGDVDVALRAAETALLAEEHRWRAFGNGELADINRELAAGHAVAINTPVLEGIRRAQAITARSGGLFNPAIGELVRAWGFHAEERAAVPPPGHDVLARLLPAPSADALQLQNDGRWKSGDPRLWLDMGAFAKGLAVEHAVEILRAHGVKNAIVNAGGDLKAIGTHGTRPWRVGVRDPRGAGVLAALEVGDDESVFTSGDYERFFEWQGQRYHHILDPATGQPARGAVSVTVIHSDAALSDAAATALFVAGPDAWRAVADNLGIDKVMMVLEDGTIQLTAEMRTRVDLEKPAPQVTVVSP